MATKSETDWRAETLERMRGLIMEAEPGSSRSGSGKSRRMA